MKESTNKQIENLNHDFEMIIEKLLECMYPICGIFNVKPLVASIRFCMEFANRTFTIVQIVDQCQLCREEKIKEILNNCLKSMNQNVERAQSLVRNNNINVDSDMAVFYATMDDYLSEMHEICNSITNIIRNEVFA